MSTKQALVGAGLVDNLSVRNTLEAEVPKMADELLASVSVQSLIGGIHVPFFDRWFDAVVDALVGSTEVLEGWSIVVGGVSSEEPLDKVSIGKYERRARERGGEFSYVSIGEDLAYWASHRLLLRRGGGDSVLVLDPDTLILASTVIRMVLALTPRIGGVTARRIPSDPSTEEGGAETIETEGRCVLLSRHSVNNSAESGTAKGVDEDIAQMSSSWPEDLVLVRCDQAVTVAASRFSGFSEISTDREGGDSASGSLLEDILNFPGLREAQASVARALTSPSAPLLSIVMRTQVHRPEALRDVLLCLAAQTDGRFEVLLVVHDGSLNDASLILNDQPNWLRSRTRVLVASGGTRSHPLNIGIGAAIGSQISFLDDDDLVFQNWVESFLDAAEQHPRRLIRTSAGVQRVTTVIWPGGLLGHQNESGVSTPYPLVYDLADHLRVNMTPLMALAFPRKFFDIFGGADESLAVCEDWDLALRAARIIGVSDVPALTAIYRRWNSGQDSYSLHDQSIWERDMARVKEKLDSSPLVVPAGGASDLEKFSSQRGVPAQLAAAYGSASWRLTAPLRAALVLARTFGRRLRIGPHSSER